MHITVMKMMSLKKWLKRKMGIVLDLVISEVIYHFVRSIQLWMLLCLSIGKSSLLRQPTETDEEIIRHLLIDEFEIEKRIACF